MHMTGLGAELRQTLRGLARQPARTALVVLTLAAGIAATTTIYTIVDAVIVRPLTYPDGDRLVAAGRLFPDREWRADAPGLQALAGTSIATLTDWQARTSSFQALEAVERISLLLPDTGGGPELATGAAMTEGFLDMFGARIELGRDLHPADFEENAPAVLLLGHSSWLNRYGGDPDVIGRVISASTIVGVLSAEFAEPGPVFGSGTIEFWRPLKPDAQRYADRGRRSSTVVGRLAEGVTIEAARAELAAVQFRLADEYPDDNVLPDGTRLGAGVNLLHAETVGASARPLSIFFGGAALLLLIAAMNSATLLLLRGLEREGEVALRRALGANQMRLVGGLLLEGLVLAAVGGVAGVLLANVGVAAFLHVGPSSIPRLDEVALNARVLSVSAFVSLGAGLFAGLLPALRLTRRANLGTGMRAAGSPTVTSTGAGLRTALVTGQLAAALVLGVGASLLLSSMLQLSNHDLGFDPENLTVITVPYKEQATDPAAITWNRAMDVVRQVPGVERIAAASDAPFEDASWAPWVTVPGDLPDQRREGVVAFIVSPGYFDAIGTRVLAGRDFGPGDAADAERVAIVNSAFVEAHLADVDPLTSTVRLRADDGTTVPSRIVGVVENVVQRRVEDEVAPALYVPDQQEAWPFGVNLLVRSSRSGEVFADELRQAVARFNSFVPTTRLFPLTSRMDATLAEPRFRAAMFAAFAAVSVLLALVGLYGSLSHTVGRRTRELGVRMALGADRRAIFAMVLKQGAAVAGIGLAVGLAGAIVITRSLQSLLYGVTALDPAAFVVATLGVGAVALLTALTPARRASRVDVSTSLRE